MKKIIVLLLSLFCFSFVHAATDAELAAQAEARYQDLLAKQAAARAAYVDKVYPQMAAQAASASTSAGTVTSSAAMSAAIDGSTVASASKVAQAADAAKAAATMAGRYGKSVLRGTPSAFLGAAAFQALMDGIGWVMDEGSQVTKPFDASTLNCGTGSSCSFSSVLYKLVGDSSTFATGDAACAYFNSNNGTGWWGSTSYKSSNSGCYGTSSGTLIASVQVISNPYYSSTSSVPTGQTPTNQEIQDAIQQYLTDHPNTTITNNIYNNAYNYDPNFELTDAQVNYLANSTADFIVQGLMDAAATGNSGRSYTNTDGVKADVTTSISNDGTAAGSVTTSTTTNADGTTSTTTSQTALDFPTFCSWAAVVCDFIDWMEKDPDTQDTELDIEDKTIDDYAYADHVVFGKTCPFDSPQTVTLDLGIIGQITFQKDLTFMCTFADSARPYVIGLGYLGSFIYLLIALRNRNV